MIVPALTDIEKDALRSTPDDPPPLEAHPHEIKSFVATPRDVDQSLIRKALSWMRGDEDLNAPIVYKGSDGLRYILSITSNSYKDREDETLTSKALQAYEDSCYIGEGVYHNDNPYVFWHDDDVVMGKIIAVDYVEPFLFELIKELKDDPVSKILFDFAEKNGHKSGASHKFGYLEDDRTPDGDYLHIYKQESTFLPDRALAANGMTYAGVIGDMASQQSDEWLDKMFDEATGGAIKNISTVLHDKSRDRAAKLAEIKGLIHKAAKPPFPPNVGAAGPAMDDEVMDDDAVIEEDVEDVAEEKGEDLLSEGGKIDITRIMLLLNGVLDMFGNALDAQSALEMDRVGVMKTIDELKEARVSEKVADKVTIESLVAKLKSLEDRVAKTEKQVNLAPRRAAEQTPIDPAGVARVIADAQKAHEEAELVEDPFWGKLKKLQGDS